MYIDRIDLSISQEDLQSVMEAFASAAASLDLLPSVSPTDRKRYAKLGLKNEALALQIIEVGRKNRHLIPAGLDFEKIDRDLLAREQLRTLKVILQGLLERVSDSMLLTGVDLYAAALSMYHCLRRNADTASLKTTVAELKKGFSRPSRKKKEAEQDASAAAAPVPGPAPAEQRRESAGILKVHAGTVPNSLAAAPERSAPVGSLPLNLQMQGAPASFHTPHSGLPVFLSGTFMPTLPIHGGISSTLGHPREGFAP